MTARLSPQREAEIVEHVATCTNWSLGNLAARDLAAELTAVRAERDRYRAAWQSASFRAEARGEGIVRIVGERESYQGWLKQEQEYTRSLRAELETRPDLADVVAWLGKKAREFGSVNGRQGKAQAETVRTLASKISRGAIRPAERTEATS